MAVAEAPRLPVGQCAQAVTVGHIAIAEAMA